MRAKLELGIEMDGGLTSPEWDRLIRRVLQNARLTRMPPGVKITFWASQHYFDPTEVKKY